MKGQAVCHTYKNGEVMSLLDSFVLGPDVAASATQQVREVQGSCHDIVSITMEACLMPERKRVSYPPEVTCNADAPASSVL